MSDKIKGKRQLQMMQSAWCESEQCRVTIGLDNLEERIRSLSNERKLTCPNCRGGVILKAGAIKLHHFAHWATARAGCFDEFYEPDSAEHQAMKLAVVGFLRKAYPDAPFIEIEVPIPQTGQRADVLVRTAAGQQIAFEVQVSPLSVTEWQHRHALYHSVGIQDIWLPGISRWRALLTTQAQEAGNPFDLTLSGKYKAQRTVIRRGFGQTTFEGVLAKTERQLCYLDVVSNPARPTLLLVCRLLYKKAGATGFNCLSYEFPFEPPVIAINSNPNPRNLLTPYEAEAVKWEMTSNNYPTAMSAEATLSSRQVWEAERQKVWATWNLDETEDE